MEIDHIHLRQIDEYASNDLQPIECVVVEYGNILKALKLCEWNQTHASTRLGVTVRTLRNKVKALRNAGMHIPTWERPCEGVKQLKQESSRPRVKQYVFHDKCIPIDERIEMGECEPDDTAPREFVRYQDWK